MKSAVFIVGYLLSGFYALKTRWALEVLNVFQSHADLVRESPPGQGAFQARRGVRRFGKKAIQVLLWPVVVSWIWWFRRQLDQDDRRHRDGHARRMAERERDCAAPLPPDCQADTIGSLAAKQFGQPLADLPTAIQRIQFIEEVNGLSEFTPISTRFDLAQEEGHWHSRGTISFYAPELTDAELLKFLTAEERPRCLPKSASVDTLIDADSLTEFLACIDGCQIQRKPYTTNNQIDDISRHARIAMDVGGTTIAIHSESQEEDQTPWEMDLRGFRWVIESPAPAIAIRTICAKVGRDQLDRALQERIAETNRTRELFEERMRREQVRATTQRDT